MSLDQQVSQAAAMSLDELEETLGVTAIGSEGLDDAVTGRSVLFSVAAEGNKESAERFLSSTLKTKGRALFTKLWKIIREAVCYAYREGLPVKDDADIVKYLVGAAVAAAKITAGLAILIVTIAVKMGLDKMCPVPATE